MGCGMKKFASLPVFLLVVAAVCVLLRVAGFVFVSQISNYFAIAIIIALTVKDCCCEKNAASIVTPFIAVAYIFATLFATETETFSYSLMVVVALVCGIAVAVCHGDGTKMKLVLGGLYTFLTLPIFLFALAAMFFSAFWITPVETNRITKISPGGVHLLEVTQNSQGALGGGTDVTITPIRPNINLLIGRIRRVSATIHSGGWGEFYHIKGFRWDGDNRVYMYSSVYRGGRRYVFNRSGRMWRRETLPHMQTEFTRPQFGNQDSAVLQNVEDFLNKFSHEFTQADFDFLAGLYSFRIASHNEPITSLRVLPELFPALRHIRLSFPAEQREIDLSALEKMPSLRAVEIDAGFFPNFDFAVGLPYVSLRLRLEDEGASNLAGASVLGREFIESRLSGRIREYVRVVYGGRVYELIVSDYVFNGDSLRYWDLYHEAKIFVSEKRSGEFEPLHILDIHGRIGNATGGLIIADINFDGRRDILVKQGHFGNQGLVNFSAFIYENGEYAPNESFSQIANPAIDAENERILSTWRNWAASHSWAKFVYENGEFVMTDILTTSPEEYGEGMNAPVFSWRYEVTQIRGGNSETTIYLSSDFPDDEFAEMFFCESSFWGLASDRWRTLFNQGLLIDWSIYGGGLDAQIAEIIGGE